MTKTKNRFHKRKIGKQDFVKLVSDETGFSQKDVYRILDVIVDCIIKEVADGSKVTIRGLGSFEPKFIPSKNYTNIRTKERLISPKKVVPDFVCGSKINDALKNRQQELIDFFVGKTDLGIFDDIEIEKPLID